MKITEKELRNACRELQAQIDNREIDGKSTKHGTSYAPAFGDYCGLGYQWDEFKIYCHVFLSINAYTERHGNVCSNVKLCDNVDYPVIAEAIESIGIEIF